MNIFTFIKKIRRLKEINKENKKILETSAFLLSRHDKFVNKYPNLAIFAFDRVGAAISLSGIFEEFVLETLKEIDFEGFALGGLSVGEPKEDMLRIVSSIANQMPKNKPRYPPI